MISRCLWRRRSCRRLTYALKRRAEDQSGDKVPSHTELKHRNCLSTSLSSVKDQLGAAHLRLNPFLNNVDTVFLGQEERASACMKDAINLYLCSVPVDPLWSVCRLSQHCELRPVRQLQTRDAEPRVPETRVPETQMHVSCSQGRPADT